MSGSQLSSLELPLCVPGDFLTVVQTLAFAASFLVTVALIFSWLGSRPEAREVTFNKIDIAGAVYRHAFLGARLGRINKKFYLDPRADSTILSSLFPGYEEEIRGDQNLWKNFFFRDFDTKVTSAALSADSEYGIVVYQSFTGCFDIVSRYGADILIFGASDLAQAVPADELSQYFPGKKILVCAAPTLTLDTMISGLEWVEKTYPKDRKKPDLILVGISRSLAYLASPFYPALNWTKQELVNRYKHANFLGTYAYLNQPFRIPWTWNVFLPIRRDANHLPLINRIAHPERWSILDFRISRSELEQNPAAFDEKRKHNRQESSIFLGAERNTECHGLDRLPGMLGQIKHVSRQFGSKLVVFTTPTMGDELRQAPACYLTMYNQLLKDLNDADTLTVNESMEGYGLSVLDFAFRDKHAGGDLLTFDVVHPNYFGAQKFTGFLSRAIRERFKP